jgi:hypothetical protein
LSKLHDLIAAIDPASNPIYLPGLINRSNILFGFNKNITVSGHSTAAEAKAHFLYKKF